MKTDSCRCHRCRDAQLDQMGLCNLEPSEQIKRMADGGAFGMVLCPTCGNKRCPHASDHRLSCTNSNTPGQPGSVYQ